MFEPPLHRLASDFGATLWREGPSPSQASLAPLWLRVFQPPRGDFPTMNVFSYVGEHNDVFTT